MVQRDPRRPPTPMLRVRKVSYFVSDCCNAAEVAELVDRHTHAVHDHGNRLAVPLAVRVTA